MVRRKDFKRLEERVDSLYETVRVLKQTVNFLDEWSSAASEDINRLHEQVDMWSKDPPLKDRVAALEHVCVTHTGTYDQYLVDGTIQIESDGELYTIRTMDEQEMVLDQNQLDTLIEILDNGGYYGG